MLIPKILNCKFLPSAGGRRGAGGSRTGRTIFMRRPAALSAPCCAPASLIGIEARSGSREPAAGRGAIARELKRAGFDVIATDLVAYEGADPGIDTPVDFLLEHAPPPGVGFICTNPPFKLADAFIRHGLALGLPVIVLLRLMALEGERRSDLIDRHLRRVWLGRERPPQMHREGWAGPRTISATAPFAWFAFEPSESGRPVHLERISWRGAP